MNNKCVYAHKRRDNGEVFYIGKGGPRRPLDEDTRGEEWYRIKRAAGGFDVEIIEDGMINDDALDLESMMIMHYGRKGDGGTLCNTSLGKGPNHPAKDSPASMTLSGNVRRKSRITADSCAQSASVTRGVVLDDAMNLLRAALDGCISPVLVQRLRSKYSSFDEELRRQKTYYEQRERRRVKREGEGK